MLSNITHKLLYSLTADLPYREIKDDGKDYLQRYYLTTRNGKRYYLHCFLGSDPGRNLHSHKWHAWSFILCGWYWEERAWGTRKVRWFNRLTPDSFHRVILPQKMRTELVYMGQGNFKRISVQTKQKQPCWTLFCHNAANDVPTWGFKEDIAHPSYPGAWMMRPYQYEKEGDQTYWWLLAPTRRQVKGR